MSLVNTLLRGAVGVAAEKVEQSGNGYTVVAMTAFAEGDKTGTVILSMLDEALGRMPSETNITTEAAKLFWHTFTWGEARSLEKGIALQFEEYGSKCSTRIEERGASA